MSTKTNVRGSSAVCSDGIENYIDTQSIGVGLDGTLRLLCNENDASTKKGDGPDEDLIPQSRMSNIEQQYDAADELGGKYHSKTPKPDTRLTLINKMDEGLKDNTEQIKVVDSIQMEKADANQEPTVRLHNGRKI